MIAVRAAASLGVPLALLTLLGREDLGLQAAVGAFLALFAAGASARERARVLPIVGAGLFGAAALGVALAPWPVWLAVGLVGVAVVASGLAFAFRLGPPGPVFFVLIFGLSGMMTAVRDGERVNAPASVLLTMLAGMVFSYLVALMPLLRRAERARQARPLRELLPGPWLGAGEQELLLRVAVVAVAGTVISLVWLDPHRAYWTVSAGVAVVGLTAGRRHALGRGLHRTAGTLLGAAVYLVLAPLGAQPLVLVLLLTTLQFAIEVVVVRNYALALVCITPLVLLITGAAAGGDPFSSAGERVLDTVVGSALAIGSALLHRRGARA